MLLISLQFLSLLTRNKWALIHANEPLVLVDWLQRRLTKSGFVSPNEHRGNTAEVWGVRGSVNRCVWDQRYLVRFVSSWLVATKVWRQEMFVSLPTVSLQVITSVHRVIVSLNKQQSVFFKYISLKESPLYFSLGRFQKKKRKEKQTWRQVKHISTKTHSERAQTRGGGRR